ncbi:methyltransferase domain-containing protein [uncultured Ruegeria sp.]|uniref:class I SAM-dependent methyltransferase n=1 Tax=uncultured Ruegeria sp. TaxID=259304 RepID=UPI002626AFB9|nr:methyltransferase domain-containing protein [uncultured Ruegeria sp.]
MTHQFCRVCGTAEPEALFQRQSDFTVTSAQVPTSIETIDVRQCMNCSHVQSHVIDDLSHYYDSNYNFHLTGADTDDLYTVRDGKSVYRAEHQLDILRTAYSFERPMRVLDYGCGKATTLRALGEIYDTVTPMVFDVSDAYTPFWDAFVETQHQAAHDIPEDWDGSCDLIVSFFALEHVANPRYFVADVLRLLRRGGCVHVLVPNMYENMNDILVVDHVNHFSPISLHRLFSDAGFDEIEVDTHAHKAAILLTAHRPDTECRDTIVKSAGEIEPQCQLHVAKARAIAAQCDQMFNTIDAHVKLIADDPVVIYGSGIYGMMILASITDRGQVLGFLDNNRFRQGGNLFGIPVLAPQDIPAEARAILVGLNPQFAREIIGAMPFLIAPERDILYL